MGHRSATVLRLILAAAFAAGALWVAWEDRRAEARRAAPVLDWIRRTAPVEVTLLGATNEPVSGDPTVSFWPSGAESAGDPAATTGGNPAALRMEPGVYDLRASVTPENRETIAWRRGVRIEKPRTSLSVVLAPAEVEVRPTLGRSGALPGRTPGWTLNAPSLANPRRVPSGYAQVDTHPDVYSVETEVRTRFGPVRASQEGIVLRGGERRAIRLALPAGILSFAPEFAPGVPWPNGLNGVKARSGRLSLTDGKKTLTLEPKEIAKPLLVPAGTYRGTFTVSGTLGSLEARVRPVKIAPGARRSVTANLDAGALHLSTHLAGAADQPVPAGLSVRLEPLNGASARAADRRVDAREPLLLQAGRWRVHPEAQTMTGTINLPATRTTVRAGRTAKLSVPVGAALLRLRIFTTKMDTLADEEGAVRIRLVPLTGEGSGAETGTSFGPHRLYACVPGTYRLEVERQTGQTVRTARLPRISLRAGEIAVKGVVLREAE